MTTTYQPTFTGPDWASRHFDNWHILFDHLGWKGRSDLRFLEIGCAEGRATIWFLEHVLTDPTSTIDVIDTFQGSPEWETLAPELDVAGMLHQFWANVESWSRQVTIWENVSSDVLRRVQTVYGVDRYDFIYVDGSHDPADVLADAVLSWPLLKPGGVLLFDDATWIQRLPDGRVLRPAVGIAGFMAAYKGRYDVLVSGAQIGIQKHDG